MGPGSAGRREIDGTPRAGFQKRGPAPARRRSGAPRGARVQKCTRHDCYGRAFRRSAPSSFEGMRREDGAPAPQRTGAMTRAC
jgi:hypothetical protein